MYIKETESRSMVTWLNTSVSSRTSLIALGTKAKMMIKLESLNDRSVLFN